MQSIAIPANVLSQHTEISTIEKNLEKLISKAGNTYAVWRYTAKEWMDGAFKNVKTRNTLSREEKVTQVKQLISGKDGKQKLQLVKTTEETKVKISGRWVKRATVEIDHQEETCTSNGQTFERSNSLKYANNGNGFYIIRQGFCQTILFLKNLKKQDDGSFTGKIAKTIELYKHETKWRVQEVIHHMMGVGYALIQTTHSTLANLDHSAIQNCFMISSALGSALASGYMLCKFSPAQLVLTGLVSLAYFTCRVNHKGKPFSVLLAASILGSVAFAASMLS